MVLITQETSISSGIRRIEAVTGVEAFKYTQENKNVLSEIEGELSTSGSELAERIRNLSDSKKQLEKKLKEKEVSSYLSEIDSWISEASEIQGVTLVAKIIDSSSVDEMKSIGDALRDKLKSGVGVLGAKIDKKSSLITVMTKDLIESGLSSTDIVTTLGKIIGGGGGGSGGVLGGASSSAGRRGDRRRAVAPDGRLGRARRSPPRPPTATASGRSPRRRQPARQRASRPHRLRQRKPLNSLAEHLLPKPRVAGSTSSSVASDAWIGCNNRRGPRPSRRE